MHGEPPGMRSARLLALAGLLVAALAGQALASPALDVVADTASVRSAAPERLRLDVTHLVDRTTTLRAGAPVPSDGPGIGPGSRLRVTIPGEGSFTCSANFIWAQGTKLYLGSAGHCFLPGDKTATHGPGADYDARGVITKVCVSNCQTGGLLSSQTGALVELGRVVYARQSGEGGDVGNDFGLVEIPLGQRSLIRRTLPVWGGPSVSGNLSNGEIACHYGNGVGVGELFLTKARFGIGRTGSPRSWVAQTPAAPGDSGSALAACTLQGSDLVGREAVGTLTHLAPGQGAVVGTTMERSIALAAQAGLRISPVLAP